MGVRLEQAVEKFTGISKMIEIRLDAQRPRLEVVHRLRNDGEAAITVAPWAITQVVLGGTALLPQPTAPLDEEGLQPNRHLVLWPYSHWQDPRLHLADDCLLVTTQVIERPLKIGIFNHLGWIGYLIGKTFFRRRFIPQPGRPHVDFHANCEIYVNHQFLELEVLGPLQTLQPAEEALHQETWELFPVADAANSPEAVRTLLRSIPQP
jgi:hypothetical protein